MNNCMLSELLTLSISVGLECLLCNVINIIFD